MEELFRHDKRKLKVLGWLNIEEFISVIITKKEINKERMEEKRN